MCYPIAIEPGTETTAFGVVPVVLRRLDALAAARGESRSGTIAQLTRLSADA